jgi:hypothetical protein
VPQTPNAKLASKHPNKLTRCLLEWAHGTRRVFLFLRYGYRRDEPRMLEADRLALAQSDDAVMKGETSHRVRCEIIDELLTPYHVKSSLSRRAESFFMVRAFPNSAQRTCLTSTSGRAEEVTEPH